MNVPKEGHLMAQPFVAPIQEVSPMMKIPDSRRGLVRCSIRAFGLAAAALLMLSAAPVQRAQALSLINPGVAPGAKAGSGGLTMQVIGRGGGGAPMVHSGGAPMVRGGAAPMVHSGAPMVHGGSLGTGGAVFHGRGLRAGPVFHGGDLRYGGLHYGGFRFAHRHHVHRRFFVGGYYDDYPYYYYPYRRCHIVWTDYGPRRVCHFRHWRHHYYWRHHHHRRHHRIY
jgi:hypothetical protein